MTHPSDEQVIRLLRNALAIRQQSSAADLWPRVRHRIEHGAPPPAPGDWILAIAAVVLCVIKPETISMLLFHL